MACFARPEIAYYDAGVKNCCGYLCTKGPGADGLPFTLTDAERFAQLPRL